MEFEPLLPDDEQPLNGRANALALWCTGFLYGLGTGQISDLEALNGDVGEIVRDFTEISRATGDDADADESNEQAYAELVEFIRVAAQVVFEELLPLRRQVYPARRSGCIEPRRWIGKEFARRRRQFMRMIGKDAIAILPAAPVRHRNGDIEYAYRQDSHFHYLTGFPEPEAVAVLVPGRPQAEYLLFVREHDPLRESWDGAARRHRRRGRTLRRGRCLPDRRHRRDPARPDGGPLADLLLHGHAPGVRSARASAGSTACARRRARAPARRRSSSRSSHVLDDMRLYKSRAEQARLRRAARDRRAARIAARCASRGPGAWSTR